MVFALLPGSPLGNIPTFSTVTRDTFVANATLTATLALQIALDIAEAMAHLHGQGIVHGDLYAHNIILDRAQSRVYLTDLGAAFLVPEASLAKPLERIEVRAYGLLVEDILQLWHDPLGRSWQSLRGMQSL